MPEKPIVINGPCKLEGRLSSNSRKRAVVIAHPHPLYGGDMNNPVVTTIARSFAAAGDTTLRFNFRGTGNSQGQFADGEGEIDDLLAARNYLLAAGAQEITLAGYSFGAWVIVKAVAAGNMKSDPLILVSPPAAMLPFAKSFKLPGLRLVITGEKDEIAPPQMVQELVESWNPDADFSIIPGSDHFFGGYQENLGAILNDLTQDRDRHGSRINLPGKKGRHYQPKRPVI